jgi:hypothetical protein
MQQQSLKQQIASLNWGRQDIPDVLMGVFVVGVVALKFKYVAAAAYMIALFLQKI